MDTTPPGPLETAIREKSALEQVFVGLEEDEKDDAVGFKVVSVKFTEGDVIYTVQFADDLEDVEFPSEIFYTMIIEMQLMDE